ncbi:unnamed protein product [Staurois parvus]|uniref:Uncharacterized protein n=1 Tax=Staurois parvus TaxID=386267 RepID=A0ABN9EDN9_9NEOB|nr:unnamed protein product [Staurois parvus]
MGDIPSEPNNYIHTACTPREGGEAVSVQERSWYTCAGLKGRSRYTCARLKGRSRYTCVKD